MQDLLLGVFYRGISTLGPWMSTLRRFTTYKTNLGQVIWPKFEFSLEWIFPLQGVRGELALEDVGFHWSFVHARKLYHKAIHFFCLIHSYVLTISCFHSLYIYIHAGTFMRTLS